jgi:hypothetical protein
MRARLAALALASAALAAAGCQKPKGSCDAAADCAASETCDAGVCVRLPPALGNGSGGGTDPTTFQAVYWSTLQTGAAASFAPSSVGADPTSGDVVVAGALAGAYDPWSLGTGGLVARLSAGAGARSAGRGFPDLGAVHAAPAPGGGVLFAGRAEVPTTIGAYEIPTAGSLVVGALDVAGDPVWIHTVDPTAAGIDLAPVAVAARGADVVVAGTGAGDLGCASGDTGGATFAARLSGADGTCVWSVGFANRTVSDVEALASGGVAVAGLCTAATASFDPGSGTTCARGLYVAVLGGDSGAPSWAATSGGSGTVTAVRDVAIAPGGAVAVVGDAAGPFSVAGGAATDLGTPGGSFVQLFTAAGAAGPLIRPIEAPSAPLPDLAAFDRAGFDGSGRLWVAGRYYGQPTLAGVRFTRCRDACALAAFLARIDAPLATPATGAFLPVRVAAAGGAAWVDDLVLGATSGTVSWALRFSGDATVGTSRWSTAAAGLGIVRIVP